MRKRRLVVVGNGMAGARTVEDLLRGGADLFDIVMFGSEPYGNYNRILLSTLLSGRQDPAEIFLNDRRWYQDNQITLHCSETVVEINRVAKKVVSNKGTVENCDTLLIATRSRLFIPPTKGLIGAILMGNLDKAAYLMQSFDRHTPLPRERISLLFDIGAPPKEISFNEMSDDVQICNCNGVSMGDLRCHFADGCRTADALTKKTRAGTGCGSCKTLIHDLVSFMEDREADENLR